MDPHFMSLISGMAPGRVGQATPSLPPLMMPLATSDTAMPSSISMIPTTTRPLMPQALAPPPDMAVAVPVPVQPPVPFVNLYKCATGASSDEVAHQTNESNKERASLGLLQEAYTELNSRKIKDPLSSFLPDIPGEFDSSEPPGTMLLDLVEHKPIGGKEFLPLSGQALLGFRLLPGPLPEQFRIDPPSMNDHTKSRKKKKHKHKNIDRSEDKSDSFPPAPKQSKLPSDAYSFIKHEPHASPFMMASTETVLHVGGGGSVGGSSVTTTGQMMQPTNPYASAGVATHLPGAVPQLAGDKKKKKKREKEKKNKKEKKKKRHHLQDPPGHPSHPLPHAHSTPPPPSSTTAHFPHPHS